MVGVRMCARLSKKNINVYVAEPDARSAPHALKCD